MLFTLGPRSLLLLLVTSVVSKGHKLERCAIFNVEGPANPGSVCGKCNGVYSLIEEGPLWGCFLADRWRRR